jgi:hypothetical protein
MKGFILLPVFAVLLVVFGTAVSAQQPAATLTGTVSDQNGAVIPGAVVKITNKATNLSRTVSSNEEGVYVVSGLPVGEYEVSVSFQGFKTKISESNVIANVGQTITLNAVLEVGDVGAITTDLTGEMPLIDVNSSNVDAVIDSEEIENLPLNGRNYLELALLTPGNSIAPNFDPTKTNTVVISSAGQLGRGGNVMIDGTDNNDDVVGGSLINISQDAVREFQVATNRFSAEYGRSASSVINVVTKGGTNKVRG